MMTSFISFCEFLQKCFKFFLQQKEKIMDKYCRHIQPHGKIESYYKDTKIKLYEKLYKEGKKEGIHKVWPNISNVNLNIIPCERYYKNDLPYGKHTSYYYNLTGCPIKRNESNYYIGDNILFKGKHDGTQYYWFYNGNLKLKFNYKEGKKYGKQTLWYRNNIIKYIQNYYTGDDVFFQGKKEGIQKYWYENGQLKYEENYKEGKKEGIQKYWYENGQIMYEKNFTNGKLIKAQLDINC